MFSAIVYWFLQGFLDLWNGINDSSGDLGLTVCPDILFLNFEDAIDMINNIQFINRSVDVSLPIRTS